MRCGSRILLALLGMASVSQAQALNLSNGWYAGFYVSGSYPSSASNYTITGPLNNQNSGVNPLPISLTGTAATGTMKYSFGGGAGLEAGYRYNNLRFEGEFLFNVNQYDKYENIAGIISNPASAQTCVPNPVTAIGGKSAANTCVGLGGHTYLYSLLLNVYYDFLPKNTDSSGWAPFIGGGLGYGRTQNIFKLNDQRVPPVTTNGVYFYRQTVNKNGLTYQGVVGINYFLDDVTFVGIDYRYVATSSMSPAGGSLQLNTINLSANFSFY